MIEEDRYELAENIDMQDNVIEEEPRVNFRAPDFGITFLGGSNGFDPCDSTSGFIIWINQKGILVDPPPFSSDALIDIGIPPNSIDKIILTHCHADHDAGVFQKILSANTVEIITTYTIMGSFVRKYSATIGISQEDLKKLFHFKPVTIDFPLQVYGAEFNFFYAFHSIPCIGFKLYYGDESIYYTGDTFYEPMKLKQMYNEGFFTKDRYLELAERNLEQYTYVLHEAGGPPIHTTVQTLSEMSTTVKEKLLLYHCPSKDIKPEQGLNKVKWGLSNTTVIIDKVPRDNLLMNLEIISSIDFFQTVPLKSISDLIRCIKEVKFKKNDYIIREGTKGHKFYVIKQGVCKIYSRTPEKKFSKFIYCGDHFGESAVTGDGIRMANVTSETD